MNRDQKAARVEEVASQIQESEAIFAVDYRGISVPQAAELRERLNEAGARFRVVKNTLTILAADKAGTEDLKELLEGPTAFTFVSGEGDPALAAKALATFRRETDKLVFKGGRMGGEAISIDEIEALARLPAVEVLHGQLVGTLASPITGLVRGLNQLIAGVAQQLQQIADQGLVSGEAPVAAEAEAPAAEEAEAAAEEAPASEEETPPAEEAAAEEPAPDEEPTGEEPAPAEQPAAEEEPSRDQDADATQEPPAEQPPAGGAAEQGTDETETPSDEGAEQKEN
jgi:large subunit ribosomal protein L10